MAEFAFEPGLEQWVRRAGGARLGRHSAHSHRGTRQRPLSAADGRTPGHIGVPGGPQVRG